MSEKGKELVLELEEEEEEVILNHWSHKHPLSLVKTSRGYECCGCLRRLSSGEMGYGCRNKSCAGYLMWHQECAEMPRNIRHPQHILIQHLNPWISLHCAICGNTKYGVYVYRCTKCKFAIGLECAQGSGVMDGDDEEEEGSRRIIRHPSHPNHELRLLRRCVPSGAMLVALHTKD